MNLAEPQYQIAKQNYYTYVSGQNGYSQIIEKELTEKADIFINKFKDNYNLEKTKILLQMRLALDYKHDFKSVNSPSKSLRLI